MSGDGGRTRDDPLWEKRDEPAEDGRGRLRRQLLTDDGLDEGAQMILPLTVGQTALTDLLDQFAKDRISPHQVATRAPVVFGRE